MRRTIGFPFLALGLFLFCWLNLPKSVSDRLRSLAVRPFRAPSIERPVTEWAYLQLENQNLKTQLDHVYEWLLFDRRLGDQFDFLKGLSEFSQKRAFHLQKLLLDQISSLPAQVIYRDPSSWSSSIWVNVGEENNREMGKTIVAKNSPVLADGALVGVVDYVGSKQARIRLITDSGLSPSVRVSRGASQNREIARQAQTLMDQLQYRSDLSHFLPQLSRLKEQIGCSWEDGYLAKGEIHGSSAPFWRSRSPILKGIGFNFDYLDEQSSARDSKVPILKEGDLLVTSGLDGVFPAGLRVGTVIWIDSLKEGGYAYEIKVRPAANNLNDLQAVFILPSLSD